MAQRDEAPDPREQEPSPEVTIGDVMPSHAFTREGEVLFVRGERIVDQSQLDLLLCGNVVFAAEAPPLVREAIDARYRTLGLQPPRAANAGPGRSGDSSRALSAPAPTVPLAQEVHRDALEQARRLVAEVRAGQPIDVAPARSTVAHIIDSLRCSSQAFSSLLRLKNADSYTFTHSVNTCILSVMVAEQCGLVEEIEEIGLGGLVHDLGKLAIPPKMLSKQGPLTEAEWALMRRHPLIGLELLRRTTDLRGNVLDAVEQHHERADGSGYPHGLRGDAIGLAARFVALADVYDAMTSERPYRPAAQPAEAVRHILLQAGRHFDPDIDRAFVKTVGIYPVGSLVRLNTGELGLVAAVNPSTLRRPVVLVITTPWGSALPGPERLDLADPFIAATKREIVAVEDPARFGVAVDAYLSTMPES